MNNSPHQRHDEQQEKSGTANARHLSTFRLIIFSVITCTLFFLLVEGLLWGLGIPEGEQIRDPFLGFSSQTKLFIPSSASDDDDSVTLMVTNPDKYYFFQDQAFALHKAENVRRIFCIGGSTTYGRPYEHSTSFCGWLESFLAYTDPGHTWEVINAGGISYASYRVTLLMKELIRYEPDLIISYTGQNEFLERRTYSKILGLPPLLRDLGAAASSLRLYGLMSNMIDKLRAKRAVGKEGEGRVHKLSKEVNTILDKSIGPNDYVRDDEQKQNVFDHFEFNLRKITRLTRSVDARLIMVAPASKLRNESPFKSQARSDLEGAALEAWQRHYEAAQNLLAEKQFEAALTEVSNAEILDHRYAHTLSLKADILYHLGRYAEARSFYQMALDEDVCPLRAVRPLHDLVIETAHEMDVPMVDFDAIISNRSPHGITDETFFLDHVHPTIEGNRILALALLHEIIDSGMISSPRPMTDESLKMISAARMSQIDPKDHSYALANLAMLANWGGKFREGLTLALRAMELDPGDEYTYYQAGLSALGLGEIIEEAIYYFERAISIDSKAYYVYANLGVAYAKLGMSVEARESFQTAIDSDDEWAQSMAHFGYGEMLEKENKIAAALEQYQQTLKSDPQFYNAQKRIDRLLQLQPDVVDANESR